MNSSIDVPESTIGIRAAERTSIAEWLHRIRAEYREVPGLNVTRQQARRLWALDDATCDGLLKALVDTGFLRFTPSGTYILAD